MNSLSPAAVNQISRRPPVQSPVTRLRTLCSKPPSPLCFRFPPPPGQLRLSRCSIRASNSGDGVPRRPENVPDFPVSLMNDAPAVSLFSMPATVKSIFVTAVAAGAILFARFCGPLRPAWAVLNAPPQTAEQFSIIVEETEKVLEEQFRSDQCDVEGLRTLMEIKVKNKKLPEAIEILNKLTEVEPEDVEWPLMRSHLYAYNGDYELAKKGFNELLKKDPFRVEAYHGLVTVASQEESAEELVIIEKKIEEAIKLCKKENKKSDARDFMLLLAQIKVIESRYDDALKAYEELVKDEPRDFRPYLCQGMIYSMLKKKKEAKKNFEKYRRLIPKGHPYASYFDENMMATKHFAQKVQNEGAVARSS